MEVPSDCVDGDGWAEYSGDEDSSSDILPYEPSISATFQQSIPATDGTSSMHTIWATIVPTFDAAYFTTCYGSINAA